MTHRQSKEKANEKEEEKCNYNEFQSIVAVIVVVVVVTVIKSIEVKSNRVVFTLTRSLLN